MFLIQNLKLDISSLPVLFSFFFICTWLEFLRRWILFKFDVEYFFFSLSYTTLDIVCMNVLLNITISTEKKCLCIFTLVCAPYLYTEICSAFFKIEVRYWIFFYEMKIIGPCIKDLCAWKNVLQYRDIIKEKYTGQKPFEICVFTRNFWKQKQTIHSDTAIKWLSDRRKLKNFEYITKKS